MDVAMVDFSRSCFTNGNNLHVKGEVDSSERVIGIDGDCVALDFGYAGYGGAAIGVCLKLHTDGEVGISGELRATGLHNERRIVFTIAVGGGDFGD
jgi:hypothetical protein